MGIVDAHLKPRKTPLQARSARTVSAICEAGIQVLLAGGPERFTTTRVAERAGVSVGSLYLYFPNKQSLLASMLERHLEVVVVAIEAACHASRGQSTGAMAAAVVDAFVDAKLQSPDASRALYAVAAEVGGAAAVARLTHRAQLALTGMLKTAADARFDDPDVISVVLSTALVGPVQGLLELTMPAATMQAVRRHLVSMAASYLRANAAVTDTGSPSR